MTTPHDFQSSTPVRLERKFSPAGTGEIRGLASPFGGDPDQGGDTIAPGAFARSLERHRARGSAPVMLWDHNPSRPIGRWVDLRETGRGLEVRGRLNLHTGAGKEAHAHLKARDVSGLSIGYRPVRSEPRGRGRLLTEIDLREISVVAMPMAEEAQIEEVKSVGSRAELRDLLRSAGLAKGAAEKVASAGWPALSGEAEWDAALAELAAEIRAIAAKL